MLIYDDYDDDDDVNDDFGARPRAAHLMNDDNCDLKRMRMKRMMIVNMKVVISLIQVLRNFFLVFSAFFSLNILHFSMPQIRLRVVRQNYLVACSGCFVVSCILLRCLACTEVYYCGTVALWLKLLPGEKPDFVACGDLCIAFIACYSV